MAQQDYSDPYGRPTTGMGFGRGKEYLGPGRDRFSVIPPQPALGLIHPGRHLRKHSKFYDDLATARELLSVALTSDNSGEDMRFFNRFRDTVLPRYQPDDYQYDYSSRFPDNEIIQKAMEMFVGGYDNAPIRTFAQNDPALRLKLGGYLDTINFDVSPGSDNLFVDMRNASSVQPGKVAAEIPSEMQEGLRLAERGRLPLSYEEQAYLNMLVDPNFAFQNAVNNVTDIAPTDFLNQYFHNNGWGVASVDPLSLEANLNYNLTKLLPQDDDIFPPIPVDEVVNHEFGHIVDFYSPESFRIDESHPSAYPQLPAHNWAIRDIGEQDAEYQKNLSLAPDDTWRWNNKDKIRYGEPYITRYGETERSEEFAERFRLYASDKIEGWTAVDGSGNILRFEDLYPNTAHYFDNLLLARMKANDNYSSPGRTTRL